MDRPSLIVEDKTKGEVKAHKRGYLEGYKDGLATGRHESLAQYQEGYKAGSTERRKAQMRDYWNSYPYDDKKKHWRKSKRKSKRA